MFQDDVIAFLKWPAMIALTSKMLVGKVLRLQTLSGDRLQIGRSTEQVVVPQAMQASVRATPQESGE